MSPINITPPTPSPEALPRPTAEELDHSRQAVAHIRKMLDTEGGAIDFARYMELALYAPELGYYNSGLYKFGQGGDFVTAPEISPLFSECLARQCAEILAQLNGGGLLEAGAGTGKLAAGLLKTLESLNCLPQQYAIIELSAELRQRQQATLQRQVPHLLDRVRWLDRLPAKPFQGLVIANEVLDAMPVQRFRVTESAIKKLAVTWNGTGFAWSETEAPLQMVDRIAPLELPTGYTSEINFNAEAWVKTVATLLEKGAVLLIDYGYPRNEYYRPDRQDGTLRCHFRHRAHNDPFTLVGLQDITSHVDFTAMAEAGHDAGLSVLGYTSQAAFLLATGLGELAARSDPNDVQQHLMLTQQVKKLTSPHEMGESFKVLALARDIEAPLLGFGLQDRRNRL